MTDNSFLIFLSFAKVLAKHTIIKLKYKILVGFKFNINYYPCQDF